MTITLKKTALTMAVMALFNAFMITAVFAASAEADYGYLTGKTEKSSRQALCTETGKADSS